MVSAALSGASAMLPKSQLSLKAQAGVCLGVLLFFAIALTIAGFAASNQTRQKMAAFAADGATVTGTITNKYIHSVSRNWVYWLDVTFKGQDGKYRYQSANVANTIYDRLGIGGPVRMTYVKSRPEWFYVANDAPTDRDVAISEGMFRYGIVASLLLLIALIVFLMWNRGGGTPAGRAADTSRPKSRFRPPRPQARSGFGTRQRL
jgi:hypothetical protein